MFVVLLIGSRCFLLFEFLLELVERLELAVWPAGDAVLTTLLFKGGDADAEFMGSGVNGKVEATREVLVGEGAAAGRGFRGDREARA